ncbi:hypothetical protein FRX31_017137 [Thalictrum thalictroides]|uniref:Alliinase C-terminal domain-containing protein n=1 Tax=Thalictrum thalictroides TaxID=46969 RepID=A0A7J6W8X8_THATH|nr:hypothetical protein FRX31_017137 [Thalictrum thalictroides]
MVASSKALNVVSVVPYYFCYPPVTDFLKLGLHKCFGDACAYDKEEPYIERLLLHQTKFRYVYLRFEVYGHCYLYEAEVVFAETTKKMCS